MSDANRLRQILRQGARVVEGESRKTRLQEAEVLLCEDRQDFR